MNKKVQVKKTIDLYKIPLSAPIVALFGMIAFAFVNAEKLPIFKLCALNRRDCDSCNGDRCHSVAVCEKS